MVVINVVGVPEHFNLPWHLAKVDFEKAGYDVRFTNCPGGTGAMVQSVSNGEQDLAVALSEGIVAAVIKSNSTETPLRYCGEYVTSPLRWMVATGASREFKSIEDIGKMEKIKISISRFGSGSHLMAFVLAKREGWAADRLEFVVRSDITNMTKSVTDGDADIFMWEWFMTKPSCDNGTLKPLGYVDTPWNCFGFLARKEWLDDDTNRAALIDVSRILYGHCKMFVSDRSSSIEKIVADYHIKTDDALEWISRVSYAEDLAISTEMLVNVVNTLVEVEAIPAGTIAPETATIPASGYDVASLFDSRVSR